MTTANAKAAQTSTGGNLKSIQRTKAAVHAKARKLGLKARAMAKPATEKFHEVAA